MGSFVFVECFQAFLQTSHLICMELARKDNSYFIAVETEAQGNKRPFPRCSGMQEEKPSSSHSPPASTSFVLHDSIFAKQSLEDTMCAFDLGLISPSKSYKKIRNSSIKYGGK